ncbi:MAG: glycosyltransferase family 4 protein [Acidimicrobiales bacterium]
MAGHATVTADMRPARIDQVVPSLSDRDAIGVHVLHLRRVLREMGFASDIWCVGAFRSVRKQCRLIGDLPDAHRPDTWWLYHMGGGSPVADLLAARREPIVLDYHNITPEALLRPWVPWAADEARDGQRQLGALASRCVAAIADSAYNALDLKDAGYRQALVVPPLFDLTPSTIDRSVHEALSAARERGGADWLFVGRLSPSKAQHDLIKAFASYKCRHDPGARLHLVGPQPGDDYAATLGRFASFLGVDGAVDITGAVSPAALAAYYAIADVFVCTSEHEGFCIPVIEAMSAGVPVVAYGAGAVPDTVGDSGLVLLRKSAMVLCEAVHRVITDEELRTRLVDSGTRRAKEFSLARTGEKWRKAIIELT